jgi:hypothetical protein
MERELFEHIVMSVCKSEEITKQVMDIVYSKPLINYTPLVKCNCGKRYSPNLTCCPYCKKNVQTNKKQELIDSLDYLKKKEHKTEKDKESISIIQAILNGMK